jgi:hypothetical protein
MLPPASSLLRAPPLAALPPQPPPTAAMPPPAAAALPAAATALRTLQYAPRYSLPAQQPAPATGHAGGRGDGGGGRGLAPPAQALVLPMYSQPRGEFGAAVAARGTMSLIRHVAVPLSAPSQVSVGTTADAVACMKLEELRAQSRAIGERMYFAGPGAKRPRKIESMPDTNPAKKKLKKNMSAYVSRFAAKEYETLLAEAVSLSEAKLAAARLARDRVQAENQAMRDEVARLSGELVRVQRGQAPLGMQQSAPPPLPFVVPATLSTGPGPTWNQPGIGHVPPAPMPAPVAACKEWVNAEPRQFSANGEAMVEARGAALFSAAAIATSEEAARRECEKRELSRVAMAASVPSMRARASEMALKEQKSGHVGEKPSVDNDERGSKVDGAILENSNIGTGDTVNEGPGSGSQDQGAVDETEQERTNGLPRRSDVKATGNAEKYLDSDRARLDNGGAKKDNPPATVEPKEGTVSHLVGPAQHQSVALKSMVSAKPQAKTSPTVHLTRLSAVKIVGNGTDNQPEGSMPRESVDHAPTRSPMEEKRSKMPRSCASVRARKYSVAQQSPSVTVKPDAIAMPPRSKRRAAAVGAPPADDGDVNAVAVRGGKSGKRGISGGDRRQTRSRKMPAGEASRQASRALPTPVANRVGGNAASGGRGQKSGSALSVAASAASVSAAPAAPDNAAKRTSTRRSRRATSRASPPRTLSRPPLAPTTEGEPSTTDQTGFVLVSPSNENVSVEHSEAKSDPSVPAQPVGFPWRDAAPAGQRPITNRAKLLAPPNLGAAGPVPPLIGAHEITPSAPAVPVGRRDIAGARDALDVFDKRDANPAAVCQRNGGTGGEPVEAVEKVGLLIRACERVLPQPIMRWLSKD